MPRCVTDADDMPNTNEKSEGEHVSMRMPAALVRELDAIARKKGTTRTAIILEALRTDLTAVANEVLKKEMEARRQKLDEPQAGPEDQRN